MGGATGERRADDLVREGNTDESLGVLIFVVENTSKYGSESERKYSRY